VSTSKENGTVHLRAHRVEEAVGLDVVEHVRLPEEHHVPVIGVDLLVDMLVGGVNGSRWSQTR